MKIFGRPLQSVLVSLAVGFVWSAVASISKFGAPMLGWVNHVLFAMSMLCTLLGIALVHWAVNGLRRRSVLRRGKLLRITIGCASVLTVLFLGWIAHFAFGYPIVSSGGAMLYIIFVVVVAALIGAAQEAFKTYRDENDRRGGSPR